MGEIDINGAGLYNQQKLRPRSDLREAQIGFNVLHDVDRHSANAYRPIRNLPTLFQRGNYVDKEGMVWAQGKFLGKYDRTINNGSNWIYQDDKNKLGVDTLTTGEFYGYIDVNGTPQKVAFDNPIFGYNIDIKGFLGPMNGYSSPVSDVFTAEDEAKGIVNPVDGTVVSAGDAASLRDAGLATGSTFELFGAATRDTMRETRNQHYNYQRDVEAFGVAKEAYITVPFAIAEGKIDGATAAGGLNLDGVAAPVATNQQSKVSADQTVLFVENAENMQTGTDVVCDAWGNPLLADTASGQMGETNYTLKTGTLVDFTFAHEVPYAKYAPTYPFVEIAGTGTNGIDHQLFYLARKIKQYAPTPATPDVQTLADYVRNNELFGFATIRFDIP